MIKDFVYANGVRIQYTDYGGSGSTIILLHGLMGRASTWENTINFLKPKHRVIALDQRGHGFSDKPTSDYSRQAFVNDVIAVIEFLNLREVTVIGHSLGALNAWVLAARRPDLVKALILGDMTSNTTKYKFNDQWAEWFRNWPIPFQSIQAIRQYFAVHNRPSDFFMESFEEKEDGYYPMFKFEDILSIREDFENHDYSSELKSITCPTLVVRGGNSEYTREEIEYVASQIQSGEYVEIPSAGHFIHYDQPEAWQVAVELFLRKVESLTP